MSSRVAPEGPVRALVFDIEGTTTPISFVYEVLFPYAREHMRSYIRAHIQDQEVRAAIEELRDELAAEVGAEQAAQRFDVEAGDAARAEAVASRALELMDEDRKSTGLKILQGLIWKQGYHEGQLKGVVYDDVPRAFQQLHEENIPLYIYSSGSVAAQKLIFGYSEAGDLTRYLSGYFDTTTGPKKDAASYRSIAAAIEQPVDEILFCTDNPDEARAADQAGWQVRLACRPGNPPVKEARFQRVERFDEAFVRDVTSRS